MAELQWDREQAVGVDSSNMREIMAERSSLQDTVAHMREELDRKEEEVGDEGRGRWAEGSKMQS